MQLWVRCFILGVQFVAMIALELCSPDETADVVWPVAGEQHQEEAADDQNVASQAHILKLHVVPLHVDGCKKRAMIS